MKFSKLSLAALVAFAMVSGTLLADDNFEYKGYMRVGSQWNSAGQAPTLFGQGGAQKWAGRLGNEDQSRPGEDPFFLEQTFVKNFTNEANNWAKAVVLMNYHGAVNSDAHDYLVDNDTFNDDDDTGATNSTNEVNRQTGNTRLRIRQAYVEMGGLGFAPDMSFWIGKKFLNREDIFVLDWYYLDFSGNGFGVTNIAGLGLDLAYVQRQRNNDLRNNGDVTGSRGRLVSNNFVIKFDSKMVRVDANIKYVGENHNVGWGSPVDADGKDASYMDYMLSVTYKPEKFFFVVPGYSKVVAQVATGGQANCMWYGNRFTNNIEEGWQYNGNVGSKALAWNLFAFGVANVGDNVNVMPAIGYRVFDLDRSDETNDDDTKWKAEHMFATVRGTYNVTPNLGFALEAGYSAAKVDNTVVTAWGPGFNNPATWAGFAVTEEDKWTKEIKVSPAVILTMDAGFYTRPQLRLYAVVKNVSEGYKPSSGYWGDKSTAVWYGAQAEAWW